MGTMEHFEKKARYRFENKKGFENEFDRFRGISKTNSNAITFKIYPLHIFVAFQEISRCYLIVVFLFDRTLSKTMCS